MKLQPKLLIALSFFTAISFNATAGERQSEKNEPTTCSLETLKGTYMWNSETSFSAIAGMESFDGVGGVVSKEADNGDPSVNKATGIYTESMGSG